jgi:hypothetical protein
MNKELNPRQIKTIQNFWNWFQDNEKAIFYAVKLGINTDEIIKYFDQNLDYVSKRIECFFIEKSEESQKHQIIFSAYGYKKLFPKIIALGDTVPKLEYFTIQTFIKPFTTENFNQIPDVFKKIINHSLIKLDDYNISTKKVKITLYVPENFEFENEYQTFISGELAILYTLGEVNFKKHIADFQIKQIVKLPNGLLQLSELPEFIEYISKINYSRKLKILFE